MFFSRKFLVAAILLGVSIYPFMEQAEARRFHGSESEKQVILQERGQKSEEKGSSDIRDRIQAILHPTAENVSPLPIPSTIPVDMSNENILGKAMATQQQCVNYLLSVNPAPQISVSPQELVSYYYEEGHREGVRPDVAFAQALKETGYFRYGGTVTPDQNNYCGLGTTSSTVKGTYFPTAQIGVRAHIQHLLAYASTRLPVTPVVDPRYSLVRSIYGDHTLGKWRDLNGRWAVPGHTYGQSIMELFSHILKED